MADDKKVLSYWLGVTHIHLRRNLAACDGQRTGRTVGTRFRPFFPGAFAASGEVEAASSASLYAGGELVAIESAELASVSQINTLRFNAKKHPGVASRVLRLSVPVIAVIYGVGQTGTAA